MSTLEPDLAFITLSGDPNTSISTTTQPLLDLFLRVFLLL